MRAVRPRFPLAALAAAVPLSCLLGASAAAAQTTGVLTGLVFDSLVSQRPLADAEVWVEGTSVTARTDQAGRFRIPALPAGRHRVTFFHPTFEALGLGAPVKQVEVWPGQTAEVPLFSPSPATVLAKLCPASSEPKVGVLVGLVRAPEAGRTEAGAEVTARWILWTLERGGMRQHPREVTTRATGVGTFSLCGVPTDVPVQIRVQSARGIVAVSEAALDDRPVGVAEVTMPTLPATALGAGAASPPGVRAERAAAAAVVGVVRTETGTPLRGATVHVLADGAAATATTNDDGAFVLRDVVPGTLSIEARALGFRPVRTRVTVGAGETAQVAFTVSDHVVVLAPTRVLAGRTSAALAAFERRRRTGGGVYITAEEITKRRPYSVNDVLLVVPGVQVILPPSDVPGASPRVVLQRALGTGLASGSTCEPLYFVDGVRLHFDAATGGGIDQLLRPQDIHGIEVHRNVATIPGEFQAAGAACGVIAIWTRRGSP